MRAKRTLTNHATILAGCALAVATLLLGCDRAGTPPPPRPDAAPTSTSATGPVFRPVENPLASTPYVPRVAPTSLEVAAAWKEGNALYDSGHYDTAAAQLGLAAEGRPDDPRVHYLLGLALWKSDQTALAETMLERAAALDPKSVKTWTNLARVRLELDEAKTALEAADGALSIDPASGPALHQRGRALALLGRRDEALDALRLARDADPSNGYVANTLGYWLIQSGRSDDAVPHLEAARDRLPGTAYVRNNLAVAYERTGRVEDARGEYLAAVESGDSGGKAAASLARLGGAPDDAVAQAAEPPASEPLRR